MQEMFERRIILTNGSMIEDTRAVKQFLEEKDSPAHTEALSILQSQELTPEQFLLTTLSSMFEGTLEINILNKWEEVRSIHQEADLDLQYGPEEYRDFPGRIYYFTYQTEAGQITIKVTAATDLANPDNDLSFVLSQLKNTEIDQAEKELLEAKRDELLLDMKKFIIAEIKKSSL